MASSSSSSVVCAYCKSPIEASEMYTCSCLETGTMEKYCDVCILPHFKAKHVVRDETGREVVVCTEHLLLPFSYCHTDKKLICIRCPCPRLKHDYISVSEEGAKCRKEVLSLCYQLEDEELKSREKHCQDILSQIEKEREQFQVFVHDTLMSIEAVIMDNVGKHEGSGDECDLKKTKDDLECCISRTLDFQLKLRSLLANSDGALIEQFYAEKNDVVILLQEKKRLTSLISNFKSHTPLFNATNFVQKTAMEFLAQVLFHEVSKDVTEKPDCEIEDLKAFQKELRNSLVAISHKFSKETHFSIKNCGVYDIYNPICTEVASPDVGTSTTTEMMTSRIRIEKEKLAGYSYSTSYVIVLHLDPGYVILNENGNYCVSVGSDTTSGGQIECVHPLLPVRVDRITGCVVWVYWDEVKKAIRVSGKDGIKIPFEEKPIHVKLNSNFQPDKYCEFVMVNKKWDVLIVNLEADDYLTTIPQSKHHLTRIDFVSFDNQYLHLFDFNSNRLLQFYGPNYSEPSSVCHWTGANSIVKLPYFGRSLCASFNVGTPEVPKIQYMVLPMKN